MVRAHTTPAHLISTSTAHMAASSILFNPYTAFRALPDIIFYQEALVSSFLLTMTLASMPLLMTFEAGFMFTMCTLYLITTIFSSFNLSFAFNVRTPN